MAIASMILWNYDQVMVDQTSSKITIWRSILLVTLNFSPLLVTLNFSQLLHLQPTSELTTFENPSKLPPLYSEITEITPT